MKKVFILDTSKLMRKVISDILAKNGYRVLGESNDAIRTLRRCCESWPDYVIMDLHCLDRAYMHVVKQMKSFNPEVKIIVLGESRDGPQIIKALCRGASNFIVKPFIEENFIKSLEAV